MQLLRDHLAKLLEGGQACETFDEIVAEFEPDQRFVVVPGAEQSAWQIVEHMRRALQDIIEFCTNEDGHYVEMVWPGEYWPANSEKGDIVLWNRTLSDYRAAKSKFENLVASSRSDLFEKLAWGDGQTLCREAMVVAQHEAYHLGELVMLRRRLAEAN